MREAGLAEGEVETQKSPQLTHRGSVAGRALTLLTLKTPGSSTPAFTGGKALVRMALVVGSPLWSVCLPTGTLTECGSACCRQAF